MFAKHRRRECPELTCRNCGEKHLENECKACRSCKKTDHKQKFCPDNPQTSNRLFFTLPWQPKRKQDPTYTAEPIFEPSDEPIVNVEEAKVVEDEEPKFDADYLVEALKDKDEDEDNADGSASTRDAEQATEEKDDDLDEHMRALQQILDDIQHAIQDDSAQPPVFDEDDVKDTYNYGPSAHGNGYREADW